MASKTASKPIEELAKQLGYRSTFTLTFAMEVIGLMEIWETRNEGWMEQGPCIQGVKLQLLLYPGYLFDLDIMIWPHTAKIWYGSQYGWVRVWQFLERRWLAFSISFAFPVRVMDMKMFVATVTPTLGLACLGVNAKNDRNSTVFLPPLDFGVRRYFGSVLEREKESVLEFVTGLIWKSIEPYIPWSCFDTKFDVPSVVTDIRHQDTCLDLIRDLILKRVEKPEMKEVLSEKEVAITIPKTKKDLKTFKSKDKEIEKDKKKAEVAKVKHEIKLSGETILAGTGRVVQFDSLGDIPPESPEMIVLISTNNLPAPDDLPIVFVNIENLQQIPLNELKLLRITHLYVKWEIGDQVNSSEPKLLESETTNFDNHRALPIPYDILSKTISQFLDSYFKIELRGIRQPFPPKSFLLFGYEKGDRDFGRCVPKIVNDDLDVVIAVTHINAKCVSRSINAFLKGEFPLYPPSVSVKPPQRETLCTNDINCIRGATAPNLVVQPAVVLQAQMTLEVSLGVVGCTPRTLKSFSRMFCTIRNSESIMSLLRCISETNEEIMLTENKSELLSGFALDTGSLVVLYIEGPRDRHIMRIWEMTEDFYPNLKPVFSCSDRYSSRIYPELVTAAVPFIVLKMFIPLSVILACPAVYARPALPLPTRSAVLKIGRLIVSNYRSIPSRCEMPTTAELKSFRLELCVAPRPTPVVINDVSIPQVVLPEHSQQRINWNK